MNRYKVKMTYRIVYEADIEIDAEDALVAMLTAKKIEHDGALPEWVQVHKTEPAVSKVEIKK